MYVYIYIFICRVCVCDMCLFIFMFIHVHVGAHCSYIVHYESNLFLAFSMPICPFPHPKSISVILEWLVSPLPISTNEWYNFNTRNVRPQGFKELIHCGGQSGCLQIGFKKGFDWKASVSSVTPKQTHLRHETIPLFTSDPTPNQTHLRHTHL